MKAGTAGRTENEIEQARRESRSLDPDRGKWPHGMKLLGAEVRKPGKKKYMFTYYRDDGTEDEEFRYRYHSVPYQEPPEMGWGRR